ncbi:DEAD/DEAH box helicase family protein [Planomonospora parontospora]|uniref:DEAD/DEAH box helicase family protein n=1 Tax=Planomonospora parontospora TaxID=58119 RepID=UPI001670AE6E|nr:DEAD/DEAH box helicase family protein [Planomonospora parontospora]GGL47949.1 type III restriction endonuclease subunit R [Planomonospora parontospora subsp. antibiotica]GII18848.1 type III restriction endonuclease subunit R [Planomonospora parontospora subsp. antibiotica]
MSDRVRELASRSANFGFLLAHEPLLVVYGAGAEAAVFTDPNAALVKCRQFIEVLTTEMVRRTGIRVAGENRLESRIHALSDNGVVTRPGADALHEVRRAGNRAVHAHASDRRTALDCLNKCFQLGQLLHRAITGDRKVIAFVPPQPAADVTGRLREDLERYRRELAEARLVLDGKRSLLDAQAEARARAEEELARAQSERDRLAAELEALQSAVQGLRTEFEGRTPDRVSADRRKAFIEQARAPQPLTEAQARREIDRMLGEAGWIVQDLARLNPLADQGVAVREFTFTGGSSDYALYVDGRIVGVIEAKREGTTLTGVEWQSARYAAALPKEYGMAAWRRDMPLPFRYESTGVETRFTNGLDPEPRSRPVFSFHRPETIAAWMDEADGNPEAPTFRARVRRMPVLAAAGLRPAQADAVNGIEASLRADRSRTLVQMATGAGKTFAAVTQSYRLLKHAGARRVLFLVDRNNLGDQAAAEFRNYTTPDDGRKLAELYTIQRLAGGVVLASTNVVITTIQRLDLALRGEPVPPEDDDPQIDDYVPERPVDARYNQGLSPESFDLIIVDECHRSIYGKWRAVLDYFDAPIVGLTATPTAQTLGFFDRNLASEYTYEQAVADRVNVDYDVYRIRTKISESGSSIPALDEEGTRVVVPVRDRRTRMQRYEELQEDFTYTGEQIGRSVLAKDQIRLILRTFKDRVLPEQYGGRTTVPKTLIFAKSDEHADDIVQIVREVFGKGNDFAAKITYKSKALGNDPKKLLQLFRTSADLRIAVTVDMIATGTDVRPLEIVFFMRGVHSAVYFEQMKGRGARTVDETEFQQVNPDRTAKRKDRFLLVDAVGVTDSPLCDARPLERVRSISLADLLAKAANLSIDENETATLASRLSRLDQQIGDGDRTELAKVGEGTTLREIVRRLVNAVDTDELIRAQDTGGEAAVRERLKEAVAPLAGNPELRQRILDIRRQYDTVIDEISVDELISAEGVDRAQEAVRSFRRFIEENQDEVIVQQLRHGSGPRLSYGQLEDLANRVRRLPNVYDVDFLWRSYAEIGEAPSLGKGEAAVTDLVSLLRRELGVDQKIRPFRSIIEERYADWRAKQEQAGVTFTPEQRWYLDNIVDVIATSVEVTVEDLHGMPFDQRGGVYGFADAFGDRAETILDELNEELTA